MSEVAESYVERDRNANRAGGPLHHPLVSHVFKTALAGGLSYAVGNALPGPLDQYAYYAPLGAVTVMYPAVADSVLQGAKAVAAVLVGVGLAVLTMLVAWPSAVSVGLVIGLGTAIAAVGWFGEQRSWLPLAALFVLTASEPQTEVYVFGYITQLPLGALIGIAANVFIFPQMSLHDLDRSARKAREVLVEQLCRMAEVMRGDDLTQARWQESLDNLAAPRRELHDLIAMAQRARRGNIRSRRWSDVQRDLLQFAGALERCSFLVEDLSVTLTEFEAGDQPIFTRDLRDRAAATLDVLAELLAHPDESFPHSAMTRRAEQTVDHLLQSVDETAFDSTRSRFLAGAVAVTAGRAVLTFVRRHPLDEDEDEQLRQRQERPCRDDNEDEEPLEEHEQPREEHAEQRQERP